MDIINIVLSGLMIGLGVLALMIIFKLGVILYKQIKKDLTNF